MIDPKPIVRLNKIASDVGHSPDVLIDFLIKNGIEFDRSKGANAKISKEVHEILINEFSSHKALKVRADKSNEDKFVKYYAIIALNFI